MAAEGRSERRARDVAAFALAHRNDRDDYDPHLHRELQNPTTDLESLVHILRLGLGTGILAMPQAFARAGVATGVVATVIVAVVVTHCLQVLIRAQYDVCKMRRVAMVPYPEAARIALEQGPRALRPLGKPTPAAIDFFLVTYQLGVCCCYIVFMANSCKKEAVGTGHK
ncbi:proton-coupled amino acid transporter-like protein CG1139 [Colias croceus]|uniref:proton-coupled amino acid transporter-like protein CG1139 n=1 Tax=Colias crocea TaxID=72248 RepID=UPI001E279E6D|nr:proton-coupled amino acid transporter-like protein CG1139 [Colias croceus]